METPEKFQALLLVHYGDFHVVAPALNCRIFWAFTRWRIERMLFTFGSSSRSVSCLFTGCRSMSTAE